MITRSVKQLVVEQLFKSTVCGSTQTMGFPQPNAQTLILTFVCAPVGHGERRGSVRPCRASGLGVHGFPERDQTGKPYLPLKLTSFTADRVQPADTGLHGGAECKYWFLLVEVN